MTRLLARARPALTAGLPVLVGVAAFVLDGHRLEYLAAAVAAVAVVLLASRWPGGALTWLIVYLPLEPVGLPMLAAMGVPEPALRALSAGEEAMIAALVLAGAKNLLERRSRLDRLDIVVISYLAVVTAELLLPHVLAAHPVDSLTVRLDGWRDDCAYPLIFLGVRHAPLPEGTRTRLVKTLCGLALLLAVVGIGQRLDPASFQHFVLYTARVPRYLATILHESSAEIGTGMQYLGPTSPFRISSLLLYPFDLADYLVVAIAVLVELAVRDLGRGKVWAAFVACLAGLYLTEIRGDMLGAGIVILAALVRLPGRSPTGRSRLALVLVVAAVLSLPAIGTSRYLGGHDAAQSTNFHEQELLNAVDRFARTPFGLGLGNDPGAAARFGTLGSNEAVGDNAILQVGIELGWQGLIPWLAMMVLLLREAWRRSRRADTLAVAAGMALLAILVGGQTHPVFVSFPASWTLFALIGLAFRPGPATPLGATTAATTTMPTATTVPPTTTASAGTGVLGAT